MLRRVTLACLSLCLAAPGLSASAVPDQEALRSTLERLAVNPAVGQEPIADFELISRFYVGRDFRRAWTDPVNVSALMGLIRESEAEGLRPEDYHVGYLEDMLARPSADTAALAELDIILTDALLRYGYHRRFGKVDPTELDANWNLERRAPGAPELQGMLEALETSTLSVAANWPHENVPAYTSYVTLLAELRALRDQGGWPTIPGGPTLKPGMTDPRVPLIRDYLVIRGDLSPEESLPGSEYDPVLESAVRRFQARHNLDADGVIGAGTLAAMNIPVEARIDQVRVNMERLRWVFQDIEPDFIVVNIAGFRAYVVQNGQVTWRTRVQVGRPYRKSPVFKSRMTYLVFNPSWTVPPTILRKDVLPKVRADVSYLAENHMEIVDGAGQTIDPATVDWSSGSIPYQIRQKPGPWNAMGQLKFMFPNKHFVFLHDTPNRRLFDQPERTFSSGCIRLEHPVDLAQILLDGQPGWDRSAIDGVLDAGQTRTVTLARPMTVMLLYWTVGFDPEWRPVFYKDVYDRDAAVLRALNEPFRLRTPAGQDDAPK